MFHCISWISDQLIKALPKPQGWLCAENGSSGAKQNVEEQEAPWDPWSKKDWLYLQETNAMP